MNKMSLKWKIVIIASIMLLLGISVMTFFVSRQFFKLNMNMANSLAEESTSRFTHTLDTRIQSNIAAARMLSAVAEKMKEIKLSREQATQWLETLLSQNEELYSVWMSWEPNAFDGLDSQYAKNKTETGQFLPLLYRDGQKIRMESLVMQNPELQEEALFKWIETLKKTKGLYISDPYTYTFLDGAKAKMISIGVPVMRDGVFLGFVGTDIPIDKTLLDSGEAPTFSMGFSYGITPSGLFFQHEDQNMLGKSAFDFLSPELTEAVKFSMRDGQERTIDSLSPIYNQGSFSVVRPVKFHDNGKYWVVGYSIPYKEIYKLVYRGLIQMVLIGSFFTLVLCALLYSIVARNLAPLRKITNVSQQLALGDISILDELEKDAGEANDTKNEADTVMNSFVYIARNMHQQAFYDVLTGLPNRALFYERLGQTIQAAKRYEGIAAVMFMDLDGFKIVNDAMGHTFGDQLLLEVGRRIKERVRESDTVARLGGDEFTVVLDKLRNVEEIGAIAESVMELFEKPFIVGTDTLNLNISIGIAVIPHDDDTVEGIVRKADAAMYVSKNRGKGCYSFSSPEIEEATRHKMSMAAKLMNAVRNEELLLHYQPQIFVDGIEKHTIGVEALLRWNSPENGIILPGEFIPLAEESGLIVRIGRWVLQEACKAIRLFEEMGMPFHVAVNISPIQFKLAGFVDEIKSVIEKENIKPEHLHLEITESVFMDGGEVVEILKQLKKLGVKIALDDFGTGYSSLGMLHKLPIDYLKIDRSFVTDIDKRDKNLASVILSMAKMLEVEVISEGVETQEELKRLIQEGGNLFQGYLFSRPIPLRQVISINEKEE